MAWRWVRHIKTNDNDYYFAVPGGLVYNGPTGQTTIHSIYIGGLYGDTGTAYREGVAAIDFMTAQEEFPQADIDYKDGEGSGYTIFYGSEGSGARFYFNPDNYPSYFQRTYYTFKNFMPYPIVTAWSGGFPNGRQDYTVGAEGAFFCCAVNDDTQELYFGLGTYGHYYYPSSPTYYYNGASIDISMLDFYSTANLYDAFAGSIDPGGGGGGEPYIGGGTSTSGGGENATFDLTSDNIDVPTLPSISASGAGLLTLYQVSMQNMKDFASYLWSPLFDVATLKKLFNDPMDAIISLGMLPFTPTGGTTSNIFIGESDSGVSASRLGSQYYELDMGSLTLDTFYDSALDLNPYTKVDLYLPYCGTVSINPDEFDGKSIHVVYHVDILTGACVVFVEDGSRVLVQSQGNILTAIPFTSKDFKSIFGAVLGDAAAAGAALFALPTGGISAAAAVGIVGGAAMNSVNSKLNMPHGGQCASTAGFLSVQKPYLIITRPAQCLPEDNAAYQGYPAYITAKVGDLTGFIKVSEAHFDGFTCTDGELQEVDRLLKEGVYVQ